MNLKLNWPRGMFPLGLSLLLWTISGAMTVALFAEIAGSSAWRLTFAVAWAAALEASKVVAWRAGGNYRWLSFALMGVTLFSSAGIAFTTVEGTSAANQRLAVSDDESYNLWLGRLATIERQTEVLLERLRGLPSDYVTAAAGLTVELAKLRAEDQSLRASLEEVTTERVAEGDGPFGHLAQVLHWDRRSLELSVILWVAVLTELAAMMMASRLQVPTTKKPAVQDPTPDDYLKAALDHPKAPVLLGRMEVARRLGIGENTARTLLDELVRSGRIRRGAKAFEAKAPKGPSPPQAHSRGG